MKILDFDEFLLESINNKIKYASEFARQFTMFVPTGVIGKWNLNNASIDKDGVFVWQRDNYYLYADPYMEGEERITFSLIKDSVEEVDLKSIGLPKKVYLRLTENYALDVKNYMKEVTNYLKKLNKLI